MIISNQCNVLFNLIIWFMNDDKLRHVHMFVFC